MFWSLPVFSKLIFISLKNLKHNHGIHVNDAIIWTFYCCNLWSVISLATLLHFLLLWVECYLWQEHRTSQKPFDWEK